LTPARHAARGARQQQRFNGEWAGIGSDAPGNWADASGAKIFCDILGLSLTGLVV